MMNRMHRSNRIIERPSDVVSEHTRTVPHRSVEEHVSIMASDAWKATVGRLVSTASFLDPFMVVATAIALVLLR